MARPAAIVPLSAAPVGINILVHGDNGVGKTPLIGTSPKCLILDADAGTDSARATGSKAHVWRITDWADMQEAYEFLSHEPRAYEWVWLDSISGLLDNTMEGIMLEAIDKNPSRNRWVPDKREYLINMNRLKEWTRHMRAQPFNFGMVATTAMIEDEDRGTRRFEPWIPGKGMIPAICGNMGIIGYLTTKSNPKDPDDIRQVLYTQKTEEFYARDRYGVLGRMMVNPTIPEIERKVKAKLESVEGSAKPRPRRRVVVTAK